MTEPNISSAESTRNIPRPDHVHFMSRETLRYYELQSISKFALKDVDREMTSRGCVVVSDWSKTNHDNHSNDELYRPKCLHAVDRGTEIRVVHPIDHLEYSRDFVDFRVLEEIRQLDLYGRQNFAVRLFIGVKSSILRLGSKLRSFWSAFVAFEASL